MKLLMKNNQYFFLLVILLLVFWIWWIPGPRVANDFSFISNDWLKLLFDIPRLWNERGAEGLGEYGVFILWHYPISLIVGMLSFIGLTFEIWERLLIAVFIFFGSFSIWRLLSHYYLSNQSKFVGSLFYLINTYPLLLIDGGQISIAIAYSLFPLIYLKTSEAIHADFSKKITAGLLVTLLGVFDFRFIYILILLLLVSFIFDIFENRKKGLLVIIRDWIISGLTTFFIVVGLNSYWLVPLVKVPVEAEVFSSVTRISDSFVNIGHAMLMIAPHWYLNVFGQISPLRWEFVLLPVLVFLAPILRRKDKAVLFWLVVGVFSTFLVKGGSEPLGHIYPWLHTNIPGFSLFRDSTKFFFLVALSYTILFAISFEEITKRFLPDKKYKILFLFFVSAYLLFLVRPVFLNQMIGTFSIHPMEKEFQSLSSILKVDKNFGRVFWIPATHSLSYSDLNHPVVEAARVFNKTPFVFGVKGSYEIFNFLREAPYMGELFDVAGISYIAYPYFDFRRESPHPEDINYYHLFLNQLANLPWIEGFISESKIPLLKTKSHQDKIFITQNSWIVFGSDETLSEATKSAELRLSDNAIIFAETKPNQGVLFNKFPEAKVVLNGKTELDLAATFIPQSRIIFPAKQLGNDPDKNGWWKNDGKNLIKWREFLQTKYNIDNKDFDLGGGWAIGEGSTNLKIHNSKFKKGDILFARVLESLRGGKLSFYQGERLLGEIITKSNENNIVRWFEIASLEDLSGLTIKTDGNLNIINALAVVDPDIMVSIKKQADQLKGRLTNYKSSNIQNSKAVVAYRKINQTKYQVLVSNLHSPGIVVFSSAFNSRWKLNGQNSVPVYGFLNGFRVEKNGEYTIEFEPQRYVIFSLFITGLTAILIIAVLRSQRIKVDIMN